MNLKFKSILKRTKKSTQKNIKIIVENDENLNIEKFMKKDDEDQKIEKFMKKSD